MSLAVSIFFPPFRLILSQNATYYVRTRSLKCDCHWIYFTIRLLSRQNHCVISKLRLHLYKRTVRNNVRIVPLNFEPELRRCVSVRCMGFRACACVCVCTGLRNFSAVNGDFMSIKCVQSKKLQLCKPTISQTIDLYYYIGRSLVDRN